LVVRKVLLGWQYQTRLPTDPEVSLRSASRTSRIVDTIGKSGTGSCEEMAFLSYFMFAQPRYIGNGKSGKVSPVFRVRFVTLFSTSNVSTAALQEFTCI
jgi:hypothetical protein